VHLGDTRSVARTWGGRTGTSVMSRHTDRPDRARAAQLGLAFSPALRPQGIQQPSRADALVHAEGNVAVAGRSVVGPCVVLGLAHDKLVAVELGVGPLESADLGTTAVAASGFDVRLRSERLNEWVKPGLVLVGMDGDRQLMACRVVVQVEEGAAFPFDLKCAREQLDGDVIGKTDGEVGGPCSMLCTVALSSR